MKMRVAASLPLLAVLACSATIATTATAAELCRTGQNVDALWEGKWYKASVTAASDTQCKVTYPGYGKEYDEWLGPDRLKIKVMWKGDWFPAKVVRREGANYLISYDGYGQDDNEIVPVSRIQAR